MRRMTSFSFFVLFLFGPEFILFLDFFFGEGFASFALPGSLSASSSDESPTLQFSFRAVSAGEINFELII